MEIQRTGMSISAPQYLLTIRLCKNRLDRALMLLSMATKRQSQLISSCGAPIKTQRPWIHLRTHKRSAVTYATPTRPSMTTSQRRGGGGGAPGAAGGARGRGGGGAGGGARGGAGGGRAGAGGAGGRPGPGRSH